MSQSGSYVSTSGGGTPITTLTGNTGGAVAPSAGNINVVGSGGVTVTGNPGTHTLTITSSGGGGGITTLDGDSGSATGTTVTIAGGSNITTSATVATVTVNLDNTVSISGSMTAGTGFTATTGNVNVVAGNVDIPVPDAGLTMGLITVASTPFLYSDTAEGGFFLGLSAGNATSIGNIGIGALTLANATSGSANIAVGGSSMATGTVSGSQNNGFGDTTLNNVTSGSSNQAFGFAALDNLLTGSFNIAIGDNAGNNYTGAESNNIVLGSDVGTLGDTGVIRLGNPGGGNPQTSCFIAGIYGVTPSMSPQMATIGSDGQMGSQALPSGGFTWSEITGGTVSMAIANGYILNNAGGVTATLPATAAVGSVMRIAGKGSGGWTLQANGGQTVQFGAQTTSSGGTIVPFALPADQYSALEILCITADTVFEIISSVGNFTVT